MKIINLGYIVELADGGPWLKHDLKWTYKWYERGVWQEHADAGLAMKQSLETKEIKINENKTNTSLRG